MEVNETFVKNLLEELGDKVLVAATKYVGIDEINALEKLGVTHFGENRVQALLEKYEQYQGQGTFEFIGTLQSNKVKYIIDKVSLIHSIDKEKLLKEVNKQAKKHDLVMDVLIQVNVAREESKHGFDEEEIDELFARIDQYENVRVKGLMMMAPNIDPGETVGFFAKTQELLNSLNHKFNLEMTELSMGMSNDYQEALQNGATRIRIGSALFSE